MISDGIISDLFDATRKFSPFLYRISDALALMDFLLSLTEYSLSTKTTKPDFTDTLAIRGGRHPIKETLIASYTENNAYCCDELNFHMICGANMSGKTTYLKQIGTLQILVKNNLKF